MSIRLVAREEIAQDDGEDSLTSLPTTLFWSIVAGAGLAIGFFLVRKLGMK